MKILKYVLLMTLLGVLIFLVVYEREFKIIQEFVLERKSYEIIDAKKEVHLFLINIFIAKKDMKIIRKN